jgi:thioredoxin reductase
MDQRPEPVMHDAIIVGGGPAGLNAALVLGRACRNVIVIDSGRPRNRVAKEMHGFIGRDGTDPRQLLEDARREVRHYGIEVVHDEVVETCRLENGDTCGFSTSFSVTTKGGRKYKGRKILFATGICDDVPAIPGVEACYGISVHHCPYCDGWENKGKRLLAYGPEIRSAVGLAIALRGWSNRVTVMNNGQLLEREDELRLRRNGIAWCEGRVIEVLHHHGQLWGATLAGGEVVEADALFFNSGQRAHCALPVNFGCQFDDNGTVGTTRRQKTDHPGVFIAGDADGEVQLVIVAAAEGAVAALTMNRELQDEDRGEAEIQAVIHNEHHE